MLRSAAHKRSEIGSRRSVMTVTRGITSTAYHDLMPYSHDRHHDHYHSAALITVLLEEWPTSDRGAVHTKNVQYGTKEVAFSLVGLQKRSSNMKAGRVSNGPPEASGRPPSGLEVDV